MSRVIQNGPDHERRCKGGSEAEARDDDADVIVLHPHPLLPKMPCGLNSMRMAMGPNSTK